MSQLPESLKTINNFEQFVIEQFRKLSDRERTFIAELLFSLVSRREQAALTEQREVSHEAV